MTIEDIKQYLINAPNNYTKRDSKSALEFLSATKKEAVRNCDQARAKESWCYEQLLDIQDKYIDAFMLIKNGLYYDAWCLLERIEIKINALERHPTNMETEFHIGFIKKHTLQYQKLYPYKIFGSPEILEIKKVCNICNKPISIRNNCGHRVGEIYDGIECFRIVTESELLAFAFVENPVQKYSVPFSVDPQTKKSIDQYDYRVLKYLAQRLSSPFHGWDMINKQRLQPHSKYSDIGRNAPCPCGSGNKYKKCCLDKEGVYRPHIDFTLQVVPDKALLTEEYLD